MRPHSSPNTAMPKPATISSEPPRLTLLDRSVAPMNARLRSDAAHAAVGTTPSTPSPAIAAMK